MNTSLILSVLVVCIVIVILWTVYVQVNRIFKIRKMAAYISAILAIEGCPLAMANLAHIKRLCHRNGIKLSDAGYNKEIKDLEIDAANSEHKSTIHSQPHAVVIG